MTFGSCYGLSSETKCKRPNGSLKDLQSNATVWLAPAEINRTRQAAASPPLILLEAAIVASVFFSRPGLSISATLQTFFRLHPPSKDCPETLRNSTWSTQQRALSGSGAGGSWEANPHQLTAPPWSALYKIRQTPWNSLSGIWEIPRVDLALNLKQNEAVVDAAKQNEAQVQSMDLEKLEAITWD